MLNGIRRHHSLGFSIWAEQVRVCERMEYRMLNESFPGYQRKEKGFPLKNLN